MRDWFDLHLLNGVTVITGEGQQADKDPAWENALFCLVHQASKTEEKQDRYFEAIPYFAWANREPGQMQVWLRL